MTSETLAMEPYTSADILGALMRLPICEEDMPTKFRDFTFREYFKLSWLFWLLFALGLIVHLIAKQWLQYHALSTIGDALVTTGIIGATLELFATHVLIERAGENIARTITGVGLPEKMRELIQQVITTAIVRDGYKKSYAFSDHHDGQVTITMTMRYTAKNYSRKPQAFRPSFQEEIFYNPEILRFEYGPPGQPPRVLSDQELTLELDEKTRVQSLFAPEITLSADPDDAESACEVLLCYRTTMRDEYRDVTNFGWATVGASLELESIPPTLKFVSGGDSTVVHTEGSSQWYFNRPFLTGQHVNAWWFKQSASQT